MTVRTFTAILHKDEILKSLLRISSFLMLFFPPCYHNLILRRPQPQILFLDGGGHQVGEEIWSAGKGRNAQLCHPCRVLLIKGRRSPIAESQQTNHLHSTPDNLC